MFDWLRNSSFDVDWGAVFSFYDQISFYAAILATLAIIALFVFRYVRTFNYYVKKGEYERWDIESMQEHHPATDLQTVIIWGVIFYIGAFTWPVTLFYFIYCGSAKLAHISYARKSKFMTKMMGKEHSW